MMNRLLKYILCPLLFMTVYGCQPNREEQERLKWEINLNKDNKRPYGAYLAFQSLKLTFPDAAIEALPHAFRYSSMDNKMKYNYDGHTLLVLDGLDYYLSVQEWRDLKEFINNGNEVLLFCRNLDSKIEKELSCYKDATSEEDKFYMGPIPVKENMHVFSLTGKPDLLYGYKGRSLQGNFTIGADTVDAEYDSSTNYFSIYPDTLGFANNKPNFVRYRLGEGHLTLHAAPLALSNYFLLQDGNENYLAAIWQSLPENINRIYWNDYFKRSSESSSLSILMQYPATRYALILGVSALLIFVLFEIKRKQRIIPVIAPIRNDSVSFVETVGRLYYNKGNHANLASKMVQQYLEWVRSHYFLNTNLLNEDFIRQLTIKSGQPEATVRILLDMIHEVRLGTTNFDDPYLYQLYNTIQLFYKNKLY